MASKQNLVTYMTGRSSERKREQVGERIQEEILKKYLIKYESDNAAAN